MAKKSNRLQKIDTPRGPGTAMTPVTPYQYSSPVTVRYGQSAGIVQNTGADWMGPLNPMAPIAPVEVAGRQLDFPVGYNLVTTPRSYEAVGFPMMRMLADSYDVLRLVIETRKDQLAKLKWKIRVAEDDEDSDDTTTPEQQTVIDTLTKFFKRPDGVNRWRPWLRGILEDLFVIDAPSIYCQRNRGGQLIALKPIDGGTVKVIIDDWGRTPVDLVNGSLPPAYQQTLKGFPAVNYTVRDVLYRPYNRRVHKIYGYSPVEQIIITVNIALRRQMFQLAYYTEGNVPEALIGTPDNWTPEQIKAFQLNWDQMFTGNLAERRHAKFVPGGVAKTYIPTKEPDLKNPMDDWLARIVCFAFSVSPQQLVTMMNRATAQSSHGQAKEEGIEPAKEWVCELINDVIEREFGRDDLEFIFDEEVEVDQEKQQKIITGYCEDGVLSINAGREILGEEPDPNPAADLLMVKTATGYVPIDANTLEGKKAAIDAGIASDPTALPPAGAFNPGGAVPGGAKPGKPGAGAAAPGGKGKPPGGKPGVAVVKPKAGADKPKKHEHAHGTLAFEKAARRARRLAAIPFDRPRGRAAVASITTTVAAAFDKLAKSVSREVRAELGKVAKAKRREVAREIADAADLSEIEKIIGDLADDLGGLSGDTVREVLAQLGVDTDGDLVNQVNDAAVARARDIAAELVGKRYNSDGELVDAKNAEYRIDDSTRDMLRDVIADGLEENIGTDAIADNIEEMSGFSRERAELIANTEVRRANSEAAVIGYTGARDETGLNIKKEWLLGENPCDICQTNSEQGAIDLDEEFESGDDAPPAHPHCECAVAPVVEDDEPVAADAESE